MKIKWQTKKIGEVCDIQNGCAFKSKDYVDVGFRVIRIGNVQNGKIIDKRPKFISPKKAEENNDFILSKDDVLISLTGDVGRVGKIKERLLPALLNQRVGRFFNINEDDINFDFLFHFLNSSTFEKKVISSSEGAAQKNTSTRKIKQIQIPLPPLQEQKRIVKNLDEVFEKIEIVKKNAERNLKNTKGLFDSYLQGIFNNKYKYVELGSLLELLTDYHANGSYKILKKNVELLEEKDYAWMIRSTDFENNFHNKLKYISKSSYEFLKKSKIFGGEIIMSKIGNAGKVYLMPKVNGYCSLAMNLFLLRFKKNKINNEFLYHFLLSNKGNFQIQSRIKGATTKTITKDNVRSIKIPLTDLDEQKKIVKKLNILSANTKKLEKIYQQKINNLVELKKSILKKAFEGEL